MKIAHFYCFGIIGEHDPLFKVFTGEEDPIISSIMVLDFLRDNKDAEEIVVHINSRGGSYEEGFAIYNILTSSGKKVTTIGEGRVSSIATVVLLAGTKRSVFPTVQPLIHNPWIDPSELGDSLTADELQAMATEMKKAENALLDFYVSKTGADRNTLAELMKQDSPMTADKALELKFATEIIQPVKAFAYLNKSSKQKSEMKTLSEKIDALMAKLGIKNEAEVKAESYTTSDGKTIKIDGEVAVGSAVTDDADKPTPSATYTLDDGTVIKTDADSKISEVTPPAEAKAAVKKGDVLKNAEGKLHINASVKLSDTLTAKTNDKGEVIELIDSAASPDMKAMTEKIAALEATVKEKDKKIKSFEDSQSALDAKVTLLMKNIKSEHTIETTETNFNTQREKEKGKSRLSSLRKDRQREKK